MRSAGLLLAAALLAGIAACDGSRGGVTATPAERDDDRPLSTELLAALGQARSYHHIADLHLADGDLDAAAAALAQILEVRFPAGAPEGAETILDARARLARLELGRGRLDRAQRIVDDGLAAVSRDSFFLANLYTVAGELHEARARSLAPAPAPALGDGAAGDAARAERKQAIAAYGRAIEIDERVQRALAKEARP